jgi:hypothetical protein
MIDLNQISDAVLLARGCYATVRAEHEDAKKQLAVLCGQLGAVNAQVLRRMQPDHDEVPESVSDLITAGRNTLDKMAESAALIESLAQQRAELKQSAWGKH